MTPSRDATQCVHHLFEHQVTLTPDAPAAVFEGEPLSYAELDARANGLAAALHRLGVGPEVPTALFVERSLDLVVALLGILKAGSAYVPLDADQPTARLGLVLEDCRPPVIVTQERLRHRLPENDSTIVCVDDIGAECFPIAKESPNSGVEPRHLAYVLYTSGSTGQPKGVAVEHRQVVRYLRAAADRFGLALSRHYALAQTVAVDIGVTSIYPPWMFGGCLHLLPRECMLDPDRLAAHCRQAPIDCLKIAPSHLAALLASPVAADILPRRHLILGGEAPPWDLIERAQTLNPECAIFNEYGPTETTVGVIACRIDRMTWNPRPATPPIGFAMGDTKVHILDDRSRPVAEGVDGELYIGGSQVARGYWKQPDLTASAFLCDPFDAGSGARLYRTGDRVRQLPDGSLEFLGRVDRQTKVRGFRVEPGEIEAALEEHAAVRQAVVQPYSDPAGRSLLAAYVVAKSDRILTAARLQSFLAQRLPPHMVPASIVFLDAMPLLSQGKVDRKALPAPESRRQSALTAPRTPQETALLDIWQEVLGVAPIGIDEDFFALGGDSLLAITLLIRVRQQFGREISIRALFEAPSVEGLAHELARAAKAPVDQDMDPVCPVRRDGELPLSFAQERIWFIHQTNPLSVAYSYAATLRFDGDLDVDALARSLSEEVRRHEIYRTSFHNSPAGPVQRVHPPAPVELPIVDLSAWPAEQRAAELDRRIHHLARKPFDFVRPCLARWTLFSLDAHTHVLLHVEDHLVHDGWSTDHLLQEVIDLYNAFSRGMSSPLADPTLQYGDYAVWERSWIRRAEADRQRAYWKRALADCSSELQLPTDRPRSPGPASAGRRHVVDIDDGTWRDLCALARRERATPFVVMLACFYALLHHYTGQTDMNVGTGVANRRRAELAGVLGMFINNLVLRLDVSGNPDFLALVRRTRDVTLDAFAHQELPFNHVVEMTAGRRHVDRNPLYQAMFSFHDTPMPDFSVRNAHVTMNPSLDMAATKFELNVIGYPAAIPEVEADLPATDRRTWMIWEYSADLFDAETIERMARHYLTMLAHAVGEPTRRLAQLSPLSGAERRQILVDWNGNGAEWPRDRTVHELFEARVAHTPDAIALVSGDRRWTYRELSQGAGRFAAPLRKMEVGPGCRVALLLQRSPELIAAMLGILRAGAAYVPLDPGDPDTRLASIVDDTSASVLLVSKALRHRAPETTAAVLELDSIDGDFADERLSVAMATVPADAPACVMYTSGSTGVPKGVEVPHGAIVSLVHGLDCIDLDARQTLLQLAPPAFDASTFEIWGALLHGARLVIFDGTVPTAHSLETIISEQGVTTLWLTASLFDSVVDESASALRGISQLLIGGEALSPAHVAKALAHLPGTRIVNGYGPTECTTFSCCHPIPSSLDGAARSIPIGRPVAGRTAYILNREREPVPIGVEGELYIGGAGVALGYLGQPALTEERFIPDPFDDGDKRRLYRTGDRARYLPNGAIEFLGRRDEQVKIRGFRIELAEIEAVLGRHPRIRAASLTAPVTNGRDRKLRAYVVSDEKPGPSEHELREFLRAHLPTHMIPADIVALEEMPLTRSGKIDRQGLPSAARAGGQPNAASDAQRDETERVIAEIWREVLRLDRVGLFDNFFDIGGHSLVAMSVVSRIGRALELDLPLSAVFDYPTVAGLSAYVQRLQEAEQPDSA